MKILIVRLSALGDIVHALPVLAAIKDHLPDAEVDWLVEENYASILSIAHGLRRRIIVRARKSFETADAISFGGVLGYQRAAKYLWNQHYDYALDLQGLIKSAIWARMSFAKRVIGFDAAHVREPLAASLYTQAVGPSGRRAVGQSGGQAVGQSGSQAVGPSGSQAVGQSGSQAVGQSGSQAVGQSGLHIIEKNLAILEALDITSRDIAMPLVPHASSETTAAIETAGGPLQYIVINPGAAWPNKRWPPERFGALAGKLFERSGLRALVTWGPSEKELAETVVGASSGAASLAPATTVSDLAVLLREAALVISGDTGPLHIAAAMDTPLVGLYGPTWPERNGPWDPDDVVISRANVCVCHHKRQCLRGAPCINEITLDEVVAASERRLAATSIK